MTDNLIQALQDRGMSEKEAKVYLTVLELGSAPASSVGRRSGLKRVTSYSLLKDLERRGIAHSLEKDGVTHFHVIDPKQLSLKLQEKVTSFDAFVPELLAMTDTYNNKPKIEYFEDLSGVKAMYDDLLSSDTEICSFLGYSQSSAALHDYLIESFYPRRIQQAIPARVILSPSEENKRYAELNQTGLTQSIMIDDEVFTLEANEINIYGPNKVMFAMFAGEELSGVIIHSKKMYQSMKSIFELTWLTHKK